MEKNNCNINKLMHICGEYMLSTFVHLHVVSNNETEIKDH